MTQNDRKRPSTDAQKPSGLRHDIDSGKGRDKVPHPDPAAAPLGTDDEAAGTPVSEEQVRIARRHEARGDGATGTSAPSDLHGRKTRAFDSDATLQPHRDGRGGTSRRGTRFYVSLLVLGAVVVLLFLLLR